MRVEPGSELEIAAEWCAGELGPARKIGGSPGDRASDQTGVEGDPQAALHRAIRRRQAETREDQLGIPVRLRHKRQCPVEPVGAKTAVERRLWLGKVGE